VPTVAAAPETSSPPETLAATTVQVSTTLAQAISATPYGVPLADVSRAGWGEGHSGYPATDIFAACGDGVVSPVSGVVVEVRTVDSWDPNVDNPATRGGRSITIVGDDGVRYYLAHLDQIDAALAPQQRVGLGQWLGTVGVTGRTSACHVHFGISAPCPGKEWSIRRGAVAPSPYLDDWRSGQQTSPAGEVARWSVDNPDACTLAMLDPFAADS
jgi:murein DD-endopeptidase MepM/ murein hydrolase activator NlpD